MSGARRRSEDENESGVVDDGSSPRHLRAAMAAIADGTARAAQLVNNMATTSHVAPATILVHAASVIARETSLCLSATRTDIEIGP